VKNSINEEISLEGDQAHFNAVFDLAWMPYHLKIISASGDHTAHLWDVSTSKLTNIREFCGHTRSVKVATFPKYNCNMFATGGRDGAIIVWDTRCNIEGEIVQKIDNRINSAHIGITPSTPSSRRRNRSVTPKLPANTTNSSVTGLVFQDENTLISCGPGDGISKLLILLV
jgi:denticleless